MPQIQILGREKLEERNNLANQALERQKIIQDTWYKSQMLKFYADELKSKMSMAKDEIEKAKIEQRFKNAELASKVMENGFKIAEKQGGKATQDYFMGVQQSSPGLLPGVFAEGFGEIWDRLGKMQPSGQERLAGSAAELIEQQLGRKQENGAGIPANSPYTQGGVNPTNEGRIGAVGGRRIELTGISGGSPTFAFPGALGRVAYQETAAREAGKPLNLEESKVAASRTTINSAIREVNKLVDKGALDGVKNQSLVDMGNPLLGKVLSASGDVKDALGYMNHLKNLIPFARGGKQLTPFEAKLVFRLVNTQGKTRIQIKRDLQVYKNEFDTMVKAMTTPRGEVDFSALEFGGGKTYEELTGKNTYKDKDPLNLFQ